ncbi:MAG: dienelactone hydrolase family protein [Proteobacteria bacterium]|nr:dienelactone hydrolase family protein [Pseudomonadota bacterium]
MELVTPFLKNRALVRKRALLAFDHLRKHPLVDKSKIGAIGFCFGGMCVMELARSGEDLAAAVTMHGVLEKSELPTHSIKSKLLILHGYQDPQSPPDALKKFADEMEQAEGPDWVFTNFGHAKHSFSEPRAGKVDPERERKMGRAYNRFAAEQGFRYALDFFNQMGCQ